MKCQFAVLCLTTPVGRRRVELILAWQRAHGASLSEAVACIQERMLCDWFSLDKEGRG